MSMATARDPRPSVAATRRALAQSFRRHGLATPELDARLLVGHALGLDHAALAAQAARALTAPESDAVAVLAARRLTREPVARIIGVKAHKLPPKEAVGRIAVSATLSAVVMTPGFLLDRLGLILLGLHHFHIIGFAMLSIGTALYAAGMSSVKAVKLTMKLTPTTPA